MTRTKTENWIVVADDGTRVLGYNGRWWTIPEESDGSFGRLFRSRAEAERAAKKERPIMGNTVRSRKVVR